jgi:hypothetical protein
VATTAGRGVPVRIFGSPLANTACSSYGDEGKYGCEFPFGWSGVIRPVVEGFTFDPPSRRYQFLRRSRWSEDYTATPAR